MSKSVAVDFKVAKETKGTFRFSEVPTPGVAEMIGSLYVRKHVLHELGYPEELTVTITVKEG